MTISSFEVVFFTIAFLVPGFVWSAVLSTLVPSRAEAAQIRFLRFLTFSCLNYGIWSWLLFPLFASGFAERNPYWSGLILFGIIFVSPVGLAILSGRFQQKEVVAGFLSWLRLRSIHSVPMAWDWYFSRSKPCWVVVTLRDRSRVLGLFHSNSFASDDPAQRDLYLQAQYRLLDNGEWAPMEDTAGVLIMGDEITALEFRTYGEPENVE